MKNNFLIEFLPGRNGNGKCCKCHNANGTNRHKNSSYKRREGSLNCEIYPDQVI